MLTDGRTGTVTLPLRAAVLDCNLDRVRDLVRAGADLNAMDALGNRPLHYAARLEAAMVSVLLSAGAEPDLRSRSGTLAVEYAAMWDRPECVQLLLARTSAEQRSATVRLAWAAAISQGATSVLEEISRTEGDPFAGRPPFRALAAAVTTGRTHTIEWLVKQGCHFESVDERGENLMHLAVLSRQAEIIPVLRKALVDWDVRDASGSRPIDIAVSLGYGELVPLLR